MTVVRRRVKEATAPTKPDTPVPGGWVWEKEKPRVTTAGRVSTAPSPTQACWAEAVGRVLEGGMDEQVEGLAVALSILTCLTLEEVRTELRARALVRRGDPASGAGSAAAPRASRGRPSR